MHSTEKRGDRSKKKGDWRSFIVKGLVCGIGRYLRLFSERPTINTVFYPERGGTNDVRVVVRLDSILTYSVVW